MTPNPTHPRPTGVEPSEAQAKARPTPLRFDEETFEFERDGTIVGRLFESGDYPCLDGEEEADALDDTHRVLGAEIVERYNALAGLRPEAMSGLVEAANKLQLVAYDAAVNVIPPTCITLKQELEEACAEVREALRSVRGEE